MPSDLHLRQLAVVPRQMTHFARDSNAGTAVAAIADLVERHFNH